MKKVFTFMALAIAVLLLQVGVSSCTKNPDRDIDRLAATMWKTTPMNMTKDRFWAMYRMQDYMDSCSNKDFSAYVHADEPTRRSMEKGTVLHFYQLALEKLVREIPVTKVEKGTVAIWHLYNMGYVVKTPSRCFAIDLKHPEAGRLVPYLDFLMITHHHGDHYTDAMNKAMIDAGKPVFSNWDSPDYELTNLQDTREVELDGIHITTAITDHNKNLTQFMTTYLVDCGEDTDHVRFYFVGDSHNWEQLNPQGPVDIFVPHIHVGLDIAAAAAKIDPNWVLSSHLLELGHSLTKWRWSYVSGLDVSHEVHRKNVFVPVWGDKFVYSR